MIDQDLLVNVIVGIGSSLISLGAAYMAVGQKVSFLDGKLSAMNEVLMHINLRISTFGDEIVGIHHKVETIEHDLARLKSM